MKEGLQQLALAQRHFPLSGSELCAAASSHSSFGVPWEVTSACPQGLFSIIDAWVLNNSLNNDNDDNHQEY